MDIIAIANRIKEAGGELYLVGGALRDEMLRKEVKDKDYCVTGITADAFQKLFPEAYVRGKSFEVFDLDGNEFAMARKETKIGIGHKEFRIETNPNITIEEDLARRDITINAMAKNILTNEVIDPYNGRKDIENGIIRATTASFKEDPLRVYRVARFSAVLGFEVEEGTISMMNSLKDELCSLSAERVFAELEKALKAKKPSVFFNVLKQANVLEEHFEEIYNLIGAVQPIEYHPEGDAYNHTMLVLDKSAELTTDTKIRFSALVHDLGKGATPKEEYPHHYKHDVLGPELVAKLGSRLKLPTAWIKCGKTACREHMRGGIFNKMKPAKQVDFIERVSKSILGLHGLQIVVIADKMSNRNVAKEDIDFETIGNELLKEGIELGAKLREERIRYIKNKNI